MMRRFFAHYPPAKVFWFSFWFTLIARVVMAMVLPFTGDEAYYATWGMRPAGGYYDHGPMVAWVHAVFLQFGTHIFTSRIFGILLPSVVTGLFFRIVEKETDRERAYVWGTLLLWLPVHLFSVIVVTDTVLVLMVALTFFFWWKAQHSSPWFYSILTGIFLGLAFLTKMLIVPYFVAWLVSVFVIPRERRGRYVQQTLVALATAFPFFLQWVIWNSSHCWPNVMFNVINRHGNGRWGFWFPVQFVLFQAVIFTPVWIGLVFANRRALRATWLSHPNLRWILPFGLVPILMFGISALRLPPSFQWPLPYYEIFFLALAFLLPLPRLQRAIPWMVTWFALHALVIGVILASNQAWLPTHKQGKTLEVFFRPESFVKAFEPWMSSATNSEVVFGTDGYTLSSVLEYASHRMGQPHHFTVVGKTSVYGREEDQVVDFKAWNGKNFVILSRSKPQLDRYRPWFDEVRVHPLSVADRNYYLIEGIRFRFTAYRDTVIQKIVDKWYQFPVWLPNRGCPLIDRHF